MVVFRKLSQKSVNYFEADMKDVKIIYLSFRVNKNGIEGKTVKSLTENLLGEANTPYGMQCASLYLLLNDLTCEIMDRLYEAES